MNNLVGLWGGFTMTKRVVVVGAVLGVLIAFGMLLRSSATPSQALLYAQLDPAAAAEIITVLEQENVPFDVRGSSIFVPLAQRDRLRLTLAGQGLPNAGVSGYEVLEGMSGFGTTSQMFDAAYWRAKEGELARTIMANPAISSARVHIAKAPESPFRRDEETSASVTVTPRGEGLPAQQTQAIQHLVAAAVPALTVASVAVIDAQSGRLLSISADDAMASMGDDLSMALRQRVERLLQARLGDGAFVVEVSVETSKDRERLVQRTIDPGSRIVISSDTEERSSTANDTGSNQGVTVASNLPEGEGGAGERRSNSEDTTTRERVNYDFSATEREVQRAPGEIERLTVAVLVDGVRTAAEDGTTEWQTRSEEELSALRDLVASAVGFSQERGDAITIKSMELLAAPPLPQGEFSAPGPLSNLDVNALIQQSVLALAVIALAVFVLRPALKAAPQGATALPAPPGSAETSTPGALTLATPQSGLPSLPDLPPLDGMIEPGASGDLPQMQMATMTDFPMATAAGGDAWNDENEDDEDPVERLLKLIEDRRDETVEVLRGWMEEEEESA